MIGAKKEIPPAFRDLHQALSLLQTRAATYVNLSQLQLALKGLESEDATVRVAVLGLNGLQGPSRLVRVLLADPLAPEQRWEQQLDFPVDDDGRGILIRYGEEWNYDKSHPLLRTLHIPSPILYSHKVEILLSTVSLKDTSVKRSIQTVLVPSLEMPTSANGRYSMVNYPVHKAIVYGEGLDGLLEYAAGLLRVDEEDMVTGAINSKLQSQKHIEGPDQVINMINLDTAIGAIQVFRKSLENSTEYEHSWFDSGIPILSTWLTADTKTEPSTLKPAVYRVIEYLSNNTDETILQEEAQKLNDAIAASIPQSTIQDLTSALLAWAETSHTELRDQLDIAFHTAWSKLAWYKLIHRVDDVTTITSSILHQAWLLSAEKNLIYLCGRMSQAGFLSSSEPGSEDATQAQEKERTSGSLPPALRVRDFLPLPTSFPDAGGLLGKSHPWPHEIAFCRYNLALRTIPPLQALAQRLVLQTLSTTALTSALSGLIYVSTTSTSVFEAGAITAAGLVWSLRRLQRRWENTKEAWEGKVREDGRITLRSVESTVRKVLTDGGKVAIDGIGVEERKVARVAVANVREVLGRL
ncbi:hypothetical protein MMC12_001302 [Toensbergia leucococca]|nr:hypothetical protein [Toensbergia leucococca]